MFRKSSDDCKESTIDDEEFQEFNQTWIEYQEHQEDAQLVDKRESFRLNCYYCSEKFLTVEKRFLHERICTTGRTRRFSCKVCRINFSLKQGLQRHEKRHKMPGGFPCLTCDSIFTSFGDRNHHWDAEHRVYRCQICVAKFRSPWDYVGHILEIHSDEKKIKHEFDIEMAQGKLEQLMEENEISITHTIHVSDEQEDKKDGIEEPPNVVILNGKDSKTKPTKLKTLSNCRKRQRTCLEDPEEIPNQNVSQVDSKSKKTAPRKASQWKTRSSSNAIKTKKKIKQKIEDLNENDFSDNFNVGISHFDGSDDSKPETQTEKKEKESIKVDTEYKCKFCPQVYCYEELYLHHLKTKHETNDAEKTKEFNESVNIDEKKGASDKKACKYCKKQYHPDYLKKHLKRHTVDGKLKMVCFACNQLFDTKAELKEHMEVQHIEKCTCHYCSKSFLRKKRLQIHIETQHTKTKVLEKTYLCGKCGKRFISKTALQDHERSDCGRSPTYQCDVCKNFYHSAGSLKTHSAIHRNERSFLCKYCGKGFRTRHVMKQHERVHTGEKPFKCTHCPMAFSHWQNQVNHINMHLGIKRYVCSGCGQRFSCISGLQSHRRAHADTCGLVPNCTKPLGPGQSFPHEP